MHETTLLRTPISAGSAVDSALSAKCIDLELMAMRLGFIPTHAALHLRKNALAIPELLCLLRTAPCFSSPELNKYDDLLRTALSSLLNIDLTLSAWSQANLPVSWEGVGVRSAR